MPYEIVVVFNGASETVEDAIRREVEGATLLKSAVNLGFAGGCNFGASASRGEYLVLLNDDAMVMPGWLDWLVQTADTNPDAGAVCSCVLFPDDRIQEAGSVIWNDGSTMPVGREQPGDGLTWRFCRTVDYGSACSLLVRRSTWEGIGGMDPEYHPAYYEDVDLCLAIRARGERVLFEPRSRVRHHESVSSDSSYKSFLFRRNQQRIVQKWAHQLVFHEPPGGLSSKELTRAIWRARGCPRRILIIDDRVPDSALGSGYGRMLDGAIELSSHGYAVSIFPALGVSAPNDQLVSAGVAIVDVDLAEHLARPEICYDAVILSRPHNYSRCAEVVRKYQPQAALVYDCEALFYRRLERQAELSKTAEEAAIIRDQAERMRQVEDRIAVEADLLVTVSADEAQILSNVEGHCPTRAILPAEPHVIFTSTRFAERRDMGYVAGWLAGPGSPNADGLRWFIGEILPRLKAVVPWVRIRVTGGNVPAEIRALADPNVVFEGEVADLGRFYDSLRVAVVPIRFGAGVKLKTVQALQYGVPIVSTTIGAEGIDTGGLPAIDVADAPDAFARVLATLLTDEGAWLSRRAAIGELLERWRAGASGLSWSDVMTDVWTGRPFARHSVLL